MDVPSDGNRYFATFENVKNILERYGVAVLPSLLSLEECHAIYWQVWTDLENISRKWKVPISRENSDTWDIYNFSALHSMLIQHHQIGHFQSAWDVRQNEKIIHAFSILWGTTDLLTSFDGMSISFPPEYVGGKGWARKDSAWLHCDQSFLYPVDERSVCRKEYDCVQGWFTPIEVREGDATLAFLEGSHRYHCLFSKLVEEKIRTAPGKEEEKDWYKLTEEEILIYQKDYGCPLRKITCPQGSLVLWDSRTIHYGAQPEKTRAKPNLRICIYVCMIPRYLAVEKYQKDLSIYQQKVSRGEITYRTRPPKDPFQKRKEFFLEKRTTRHHPINFTAFAKKPRVYSKKDLEKEEMTEVPTPKLTAWGMRIAGITQEEYLDSLGKTSTPLGSYYTRV